jgi:hypothetical protein
LNEIEGRLMGVLVILDFDEIIRDRNFVVEVRTEEELRDRLFFEFFEFYLSICRKTS